MNDNSKNNRREFLKTTGKAGLAAGFAATVLPSWACATAKTTMVKMADDILYTQQPLPYAYGALQPAIDTMTMEIHYSKHAAAYCKNLNEAMHEEKVEESKTIEDILKNISKV